MRYKRIYAAALSLAIVLPSQAISENWQRITSEANYRAKVADKKMVFDWGWVQVKSNGRIVGKHAKLGRMKGAWNWQKGYWCRSIKSDKRDLGSDCQVVQISGNKVRSITQQGKGEIRPAGLLK